jgi:hypothetical protein
VEEMGLVKIGSQLITLKVVNEFAPVVSVFEDGFE